MSQHNRAASAEAVARVLRDGESGTEKLCRRCNEWWPADTEFFTRDRYGAGGLFYCCRACYRDMTRVNEAKKAGLDSDADSAPRAINFIFTSGFADPLPACAQDRRFWLCDISKR